MLSFVSNVCACTDVKCYSREYLPELVPVEVPEHRAKEWFQSLLSGVQFLHSRGVVHNDIKCVTGPRFVLELELRGFPIRPANILLSEKQVPVLVDFGFAEKYDLQSTKAFCSNLTYGTPEVCEPFFSCASSNFGLFTSIYLPNGREASHTTLARRIFGLSV